MKNEGGSAPFVTEFPILGCAEAKGQCDSDDDGTEQRITLAINNTLTLDRIPQGEWRSLPPRSGNFWRPTLTRVETARTFLGYTGILEHSFTFLERTCPFREKRWFAKTTCHPLSINNSHGFGRPWFTDWLIWTWWAWVTTQVDMIMSPQKNTEKWYRLERVE